MYLKASLINEIRIMRADNVALHSQGKMEPVLLRSPSQIDEDEEKSAENQALRGGILAQLHRKIEPE